MIQKNQKIQKDFATDRINLFERHEQDIKTVQDFYKKAIEECKYEKEAQEKDLVKSLEVQLQKKIESTEKALFNQLEQASLRLKKLEHFLGLVTNVLGRVLTYII